jgi:D-alanyl-D-alanine carboxypeptidase
MITTSSTSTTHPHAARRRVAAACLVAVSAVGVLSTTATAQPAHRPTSLERALDAVVDAGAPGAIVLVRDGARTTRLTSGLGNLSPAQTIRASDRTRIGGLTKSFTATVVLQLVDEGVLRLDDNVEQWLPATISNGADVTIRHLLNHTSGIYNYSNDPTVLAPYMSGDLTHQFDPADGIRIAAAYGPQFQPGTALEYSNTNSLLLALIVEQATGRSFASELNRRVIRPLGLDDTSYPTASRIAGRHVHGYLFLEEGPFDVTPWSPSMFGASGAIVSDADDVADFYRSLLRGRLTSRRQLTAMKTIDPVATGGIPDAGIEGGGWGLGLLREELPCGIAWGHDSETPGYLTAAWNSEDGARQVVVIVNTRDDHDDPVATAVRDLLVTAYCDR